MVLGGANVWTNFSYGYRNETPSGWLLSPNRNKLILFNRNKNLKQWYKIFTHSYYANEHGYPQAIKSSSQMPLDEAWNKWHELQLEDGLLKNLNYLNKQKFNNSINKTILIGNRNLSLRDSSKLAVIFNIF